jgi:hypothetical protein
MKKLDTVLIAVLILIVFVGIKSLFSFRLLLQIAAGTLVICLFLYKQIKPHKHALFAGNRKWFSYIERLYDWVFSVVSVSPVRLGPNLSIDLSAIIVLTLLIVLLLF